VGLALLGQEVRGAAILEDHSSTWTAAGLNSTIARVQDNILPQDLFERVVEEVLVFEQYEKEERARHTQGGAYMHGKGGTFWRPLFNSKGEFLKPRFAIEAAIIRIYQADIAAGKHPRVDGAEWWVQKRGLGEDIGFHHDKDEGMASLKMTMKFPEVSTVTYLTDAGAPTIVFNQTTPDGNSHIPEVPETGFYSYARANRHLLFRGNLQHGVPAALAEQAVIPASRLVLRGTGGKRITFLINWWAVKPMAPNCQKVPTELAKKLKVYDKKGARHLLKNAQRHAPTPVVTQPVLVPDGTHDTRRHEIELPGGDLIWFDSPLALGSGAYSVAWGEEAIHGNIMRLDLVGQGPKGIFHDPRAKLLIFTSDETRVLPYLQAISKEHQSSLRGVLVTPSKNKDALSAFGLTERDLPTIGIHVTKPQEVKYLLKKGVKVTEKSLRKMVASFHAGKLTPIGGVAPPAADEDDLDQDGGDD